MKTKRERAILIAFLALTVGLAVFLSYTLYVWVGVAFLLKNFDSGFAVDTVTVEDQINSTWVNMTTTISNGFPGSYLDLYVSVQRIYLNQTQINLFGSGGQKLYEGSPAVRLIVSPSETKTVILNFAVPSEMLSPQDIIGATFYFRVYAATLVNDNPVRIEFTRTYAGST